MLSVTAVRSSLGRLNLFARRTIAARVVDWARRQGARAAEHNGVTVVTVTWNSLPFLQGFVQGVRKFGGDSVEILVIDNHSTDGTQEYLAEQPDIRVIRTPLNIGHGLGLDLALARSRTSTVVVLDVDAFPIAADWLSVVLDPLAQGAVVAGAYVQRAFIHPSFLAIRRADYFRLNLRFVPIGVKVPAGARPRGLFMDVAEALCQTVAVAEGSAKLHRVPITSTRGDSLVGAIYGGVVYHNFFSTQGPPELMEQSRLAWAEAVQHYLS